MNKIKHIAIKTPDPEKTAAFYKEVFGLQEVGKGMTGVYLSDGHINLAILKVLEHPEGPDLPGFHHFGFQVDDIEDICSKYREDYDGETSAMMASIRTVCFQNAINADLTWRAMQGQIGDSFDVDDLLNVLEEAYAKYIKAHTKR